MQHTVTPLELSHCLTDGKEIALLDVREAGQYGWNHLFHTVNLPYSRLEIDIARFVPRRGTRVVLVDEDGRLAPTAARRLAALGYENVRVLEGGVQGWKAAGLQLFAGVYVPSKTFGELLEHSRRTPSISARELAERLARREDLVVIDGRPFEEYRKMSIPGAINCPNGELALRIRSLVPDSQTRIVINCAGRTRSILGAQTLIDLGVDNPVYALENGTQGWYLADLELEHGGSRRYPEGMPPDLAQARLRAGELAGRAGVPRVGQDTLRQWLADDARTAFLCDVRSREEFDAGTLPGARHTPGGQLIQATDTYLGVLGARVVLFDGEGVRAPVVAYWLRQMGWDAHVLEEGVGADLGQAAPSGAWQAPALRALDTAGLAARQAARAVLIDVRPGMAYRAGHLEGARWSIRPLLAGLAAEARLADDERPVVLIAEHDGVAALAWAELRDAGIAESRLAVHRGAVSDWRAAGLPVVATPEDPSNEHCIDYLFFVHDRHDGNKSAARQYLAWEMNLVQQLGDLERSRFRLGD